MSFQGPHNQPNQFFGPALAGACIAVVLSVPAAALTAAVFGSTYKIRALIYCTFLLWAVILPHQSGRSVSTKKKEGRGISLLEDLIPAFFIVVSEDLFGRTGPLPQRLARRCARSSAIVLLIHHC